MRTTVDGILNDLRYAARLTRHSPLFALAALISLAVGIGINAAVFSIARAAFLRSWPAPAPERLVGIRSITRDVPESTFSYADYRQLNVQTHTLAGVLAYSRHVKSLRVGVETKLILYDLVSSNYFEVLGMRPALGRTFFASESAQQPVVVISDQLWRQTFGAIRRSPASRSSSAVALTSRRV
jgi:hypothetical protein